MNPNDTLQICVAGNWRLGQGDRYASLYPATGEPIAWLNAASVADVEEAIVGADLGVSYQRLGAAQTA